MTTEQHGDKGNFFEFKIPPVDCPDCKHPRQEFGNLRICSFCGNKEQGDIIVLGKKLNPRDFHDFMEAGEAIFRHMEHHNDPQKIITILTEGLYIWGFALNVLSGKTEAMMKMVQEYSIKVNVIMKHLGIKEKDFKTEP